MFGGFLVPRKTKLYREFVKAFDKGEAKEFLDKLTPMEIDMLISEVKRLILDNAEQHLYKELRREIENNMQIGFSLD